MIDILPYQGNGQYRFARYCISKRCRGGGTGGAGGAIAPPTFGSSIITLSYSTTNIFGGLNIY